MQKHLLALPCVLALASCASIVSKSEYAVTLDTEPPGALLTVVDKSGATVHSGTAPLTVTLPADAGYFSAERYTIEADLEGYETQSSVLAGRLDGWFLGNILFGGLLGFLIIDPATGAMWSLPDEHTLQLYRPGEAPEPEPEVVADLDDDF